MFSRPNLFTNTSRPMHIEPLYDEFLSNDEFETDIRPTNRPTHALSWDSNRRGCGLV